MAKATVPKSENAPATLDATAKAMAKAKTTANAPSSTRAMISASSESPPIENQARWADQ